MLPSTAGGLLTSVLGDPAHYEAGHVRSIRSRLEPHCLTISPALQGFLGRRCDLARWVATPRNGPCWTDVGLTLDIDTAFSAGNLRGQSMTRLFGRNRSKYSCTLQRFLGLQTCPFPPCRSPRVDERTRPPRPASSACEEVEQLTGDPPGARPSRAALSRQFRPAQDPRPRRVRPARPGAAGGLT